jgi:DNA-binding NarL/FixJ family response regulator
MIDEILSKRELEITRLISMGYSREDIANMLVLTRATIQSHIARIMSKLGISEEKRGSQSSKYLRVALLYLKDHREVLDEVEL